MSSGQGGCWVASGGGGQAAACWCPGRGQAGGRERAEGKERL